MEEKINMEACFAAHPVNGILSCGCLQNCPPCTHPENCAFYKTKKQNRMERHEAMKRIASFPPMKQKDIADAYYEGKMPWLKIIFKDDEVTT